MKNKLMLLLVSMVILLPALASTAKAEDSLLKPATVDVGVRLVNVEKVDLAANSYRIDFYLWFMFDPSEISLNDVKDFEFLNGAPSMYETYSNETEGFMEYRVRGDFIKTFDFSRYPFESNQLLVQLEHKNMNTTYIVYRPDPDSSIDSGVNVVGWNLVGFEPKVVEHRFSDTSFSQFVLSITIQRPQLSSFVKSVLPVAVITAISLLSFFISPQNFSQRIGLGVTSLLSASAFHLSLLSSLPPTGYLTLADRMMLAIYLIFLFNLGVSVYLMKLVDAKKISEAEKFNRKAIRILLILIVALVAVQIF